MDIKDGVETEKDLTTRLMAVEELEDELLEDEFLDLETEDSPDDEIDMEKLEQEISELEMFISWASNIQVDTKSKTL